MSIQLPYSFDLRDGDPLSYYFTTQNDIAYRVRFKPSGYIFEDDPKIQPFIFEISILVIDNPTDKSPPTDRQTAITIAQIFEQFFYQYERVVVYVCDTSDRRGLLRHRKFISWFQRYEDGGYIQLSDSIKDENGVVYFTSLILRRDNPNRSRILMAFDRLIAGNTK